MRSAVRNSKAPSLVDLCVKVAIDHVRYIGDVGATDFHLLERFLPHCNEDQLALIEKSTQVRNCSSCPLLLKSYNLGWTLKF